MCSDSTIPRQQFLDTNEVVADEIEHEVCGDVVRAPQLGLAHRAVLLPPTKNAFNHLAAGLRLSVTGVPGCSSVNGASPVRVVLRDMRRDVLRAQAFDVFFDVVACLR